MNNKIEIKNIVLHPLSLERGTTKSLIEVEFMCYSEKQLLRIVFGNNNTIMFQNSDMMKIFATNERNTTHSTVYPKYCFTHENDYLVFRDFLTELKKEVTIKFPNEKFLTKPLNFYAPDNLRDCVDIVDVGKETAIIIIAGVTCSIPFSNEYFSISDSGIEKYFGKITNPAYNKVNFSQTITTNVKNKINIFIKTANDAKQPMPTVISIVGNKYVNINQHINGTEAIGYKIVDNMPMFDIEGVNDKRHFDESVVTEKISHFGKIYADFLNYKLPNAVKAYDKYGSILKNMPKIKSITFNPLNSKDGYAVYGVCIFNLGGGVYELRFKFSDFFPSDESNKFYNVLLFKQESINHIFDTTPRYNDSNETYTVFHIDSYMKKNNTNYAFYEMLFDELITEIYLAARNSGYNYFAVFKDDEIFIIDFFHKTSFTLDYKIEGGYMKERTPVSKLYYKNLERVFGIPDNFKCPADKFHAYSNLLNYVIPNKLEKYIGRNIVLENPVTPVSTKGITTKYAQSNILFKITDVKKEKVDRDTYAWIKTSYAGTTYAIPAIYNYKTAKVYIRLIDIIRIVSPTNVVLDAYMFDSNTIRDITDSFFERYDEFYGSYYTAIITLLEDISTVMLNTLSDGIVASASRVVTEHFKISDINIAIEKHTDSSKNNIKINDVTYPINTDTIDGYSSKDMEIIKSLIDSVKF